VLSPLLFIQLILLFSVQFFLLLVFIQLIPINVCISNFYLWDSSFLRHRRLFWFFWKFYNLVRFNLNLLNSFKWLNCLILLNNLILFVLDWACEDTTSCWLPQFLLHNLNLSWWLSGLDSNLFLSAFKCFFFGCQVYLSTSFISFRKKGIYLASTDWIYRLFSIWNIFFIISLCYYRIRVDFVAVVLLGQR
jgi:hypothetical protein